MAGPEEHCLWATPQRLRRAHRRVDAELAGRIVRRRNNPAAVRISAYYERARAERGVLEFLDGREERVEVKVGDDHAERLSTRRDGVHDCTC